ncbi:MAG: aldolase [bacterium]|jgi:hypothetical protein
MNKRERQMLDLLKQGRDQYGYVGVKAEFEAEGTRTDELLRLIELARKADLNVGLKIGGCEAVRDLIESKQFGVEYVIAPMIETPYALQKFIDAKNRTYTEEEKESTQFLFNLETETGFTHKEKLFEVACSEGGTDGVVFGRVDYSLSKNVGRDQINSDQITQDASDIARMAVNHQELVVGGGVSIDALPALREIHRIHLTRFETRKIIFSATSLETEGVNTGLLQAVHFELLWLQNKRDHYRFIELEDEKRISMLEERWRVLGQ